MRWWFAVLFIPGCIWITEADLTSFNDRDGDGVNYKQDCDDNNGEVAGELQYYPDVDGDGFGDDAAQARSACEGEQDPGYVTDNTDCDDTSADANTSGTEACDNTDTDEDCNGYADDQDDSAEGKVTYYPDMDGDAFGDIDSAGEAFCDPPSAYVTDNSDCDDSLESVNPSESEICDDFDLDEDCNGLADDQDVGGVDEYLLWYDDVDGDGYGDVDDLSPTEQCDQPPGQAEGNTDCDDDAPGVNPGEIEVCDPADIDEDCTGTADNDDPGATGLVTFYPDMDEDGFGDENAVLGVDTVDQCDGGQGWAADNTDCDDLAPGTNPLATEICDDLDADEDCNGFAEDPDPDLDLASRIDWYPDLDFDGYGDEVAPPFTACDAANQVADNTDCDDTNPDINPGVLDRPNDGDLDCDTLDYVCGESMVRVYPAGSLDPDADYTSIQAAIDDFLNDPVGFPGTLCDGDIIEVTPGLYDENISFNDVDPHIIGVVGAAVTTIDGNRLGRTVNMSNTSATLEGFTITGGDAGVEVLKEGGGVRVFYGTDVVLRDLIVEDNWSSVAGGIDINNPTDVQIIDTEIRENLATSGLGQNAGGIRIKAVGGAGGGTVLLDNLVIDGNEAGNQDGGVRVSLATSAITVIIQDTEITNNNAVDTGGLGVRTAQAIEVRDSNISSNDGAARIGGAYLEFAPVIFDGVTFDFNTTGGTLSALQAADLTGDIEFVDCSFTNNIVNGNGYALLVKGSESFGAVMNGVIIARNYGHSVAFFGGGAALEGFSDVTNALVYDNTGFYGMVLDEEQVIPGPADPAAHSVINSSFVGNDGDGLRVVTAAAIGITVKNVISSDNGGYGITNGDIPPNVTFSDVFGNGLGGYSDADQTGIAGNLAVDPMFVNVAGNSSTWDLHLDVGSTLIDAGDPDPSFDDIDGTQCDMGYYGGPGAP